MPLVDVSDGPVFREDPGFDEGLRQLARMQELADELEAAKQRVPTANSAWHSTLQASIDALNTCADAIDAWLEMQHEVIGG